jgi:hypothetical protein
MVKQLSHGRQINQEYKKYLFVVVEDSTVLVGNGALRVS